MRRIKASEFKAKCLKLMDEVAKTGEPIIITKNGQPVSQLIPYRRKPKTLFGATADALTLHGDVVSPTGVEWEANR